MQTLQCSFLKSYQKLNKNEIHFFRQFEQNFENTVQKNFLDMNEDKKYLRNDYNRAASHGMNCCERCGPQFAHKEDSLRLLRSHPELIY